MAFVSSAKSRIDTVSMRDFCILCLRRGSFLQEFLLFYFSYYSRGIIRVGRGELFLYPSISAHNNAERILNQNDEA